MPTPFGPYQLLRRIASGGMGEVYLAVLKRDGGFTKTVALKTILPQLAERPDFATRFEAEATTAALLNHPNIVQVFDHGRIEDRSYLTMEFVEGPDLARLIAACAPQPLPPAIAVEVAVQICRALGHAHARKDLEGRPVGIVHGDVSPSNVLLSLDGAAKLTDFGLARLAAATGDDRAVAGKLAYMSPEQALGQPLSPASDLYSLGLVLFELLTGRRAFEAEGDTPAVLQAVRVGRCPSLAEIAGDDVPAGLCRAVGRALQVDPQARPTSAAELAAQLTSACPPAGPEALTAFLAERLPDAIGASGLRPEPTEVADQPVSPTAAEPDGPLAPAAQAKHWKAALIGLVVLTWGTGLAWWALHDPPPPRPKPPVRKVPAAPAGLAASLVAPEPTPETADGGTEDGGQAAEPPAADPDRPLRKIAKRRIRPPKVEPAPVPAPPALGIELPAGVSAQVDHRAATGRELGLAVDRAHLIQLATSTEPRREVMLRLQPPKAGCSSWRLSVRSKPWMRIRLAGRPAGQTPRAGLALPAGQVRLELSRDQDRIQIGFQVPGQEPPP